jgi:glycosyltransferase involved in cell wall biosynthesis
VDDAVHVAIDARLVDYAPGGIAQYTVQLGRALAEIAGQVRFTALRAARPKLRAEPLDGLAVRRLWTPPHHRLEQLTLPLELLPLGADLLHSPDFIPPWHRRGPSVVTVHDLGFLRFPETLTAASRRYYGQIGRAVRRAERIIAVSQSTRDDLVELVQADPARIDVVLEAANPAFGPVDDERLLAAARDRLGVSRPYFLFVGSFEPRKNLVRLLEAFARVRQQADLELVLLGRRGWLDEPIFQRLAELQLEPFVRVVAGVPNEQLPPIYGAALALTFPSLYEGFGLPALEAMTCGCPVLTSNVGSLPEVVGPAGLLVSPFDVDGLATAMLRLASDQALRSDLVAGGLQRAAEFSWHRAARETLAVYRRALA